MNLPEPSSKNEHATLKPEHSKELTLYRDSTAPVANMKDSSQENVLTPLSFVGINPPIDPRLSPAAPPLSTQSNSAGVTWHKIVQDGVCALSVTPIHKKQTGLPLSDSSLKLPGLPATAPGGPAQLNNQLVVHNITNVKSTKSSIGINGGRWTEIEHQSFLCGLRLYGREWKKVASKIKTRTSAQIRSHAQKYFARLARDEEARRNGFGVHKVTSLNKEEHAVEECKTQRETLGENYFVKPKEPTLLNELNKPPNSQVNNESTSVLPGEAILIFNKPLALSSSNGGNSMNLQADPSGKSSNYCTTRNKLACLVTQQQPSELEQVHSSQLEQNTMIERNINCPVHLEWPKIGNDICDISKAKKRRMNSQACSEAKDSYTDFQPPLKVHRLCSNCVKNGNQSKDKYSPSVALLPSHEELMAISSPAVRNRVSSLMDSEMCAVQVLSCYATLQNCESHINNNIYPTSNTKNALDNFNSSMSISLITRRSTLSSSY